jgi:hypothetical protein
LGLGESAAIRQVDHHGQFTAAAGHRLHTVRAYPQEYWNRAGLAGMARGWPKGTAAALGPDAEAAIVALVDALPVASQGQLVALVQHTGSQTLDAKIVDDCAAGLRRRPEGGSSAHQRNKVRACCSSPWLKAW